MSKIKVIDNQIEMDILKIPDQTKYWFVRAGQGAEFFYDFKYNNFISIGDNEINLESLLNIESKYRVDSDILKDRYKYLFNVLYIKLILDNEDFANLPKSDQEDKIESVKRSSTISAYKAYSFIEEMNIGDYIFVPHKSSNAFLLGIIISDVFESDITHEFFGPENEYAISNYNKKRRVAWIKEFDKDDLPDKLKWIQNGHKAIFDITSSADEINPIISSTYVYKGKMHLKIDVTTEKNITSTQWLNYQKVIHENAAENADNLYQKTDVQSPGKIILETLIENWDTIGVIFFLLFGDAEFELKGAKFKTHGPLASFVPGAKKRKEAAAKKESIEIEKSTLELREKQAVIEKQEIENAHNKKLYAAELELKELEVEQKRKALEQNDTENTKKDINVKIDVQQVSSSLFEESDEEEKSYATNPVTQPSDEELNSLSEMGIIYKSNGNDISHETQKKISIQETDQS